MMTQYLLRLLLLVPLVAGLAVAALWLYRRVQPGMAIGRRERAVRIVDAAPLGAMTRLAVVDFAGRRLLIAVSRGRVDLLADSDAPVFRVPDE